VIWLFLEIYLAGGALQGNVFKTAPFNNTVEIFSLEHLSEIVKVYEPQ